MQIMPMPRPRKGLFRTVASCLLIVVLSVGLLVSRLVGERLPDVEQLSAQGLVVLPRPREMPPLALVDEDGRSFSPHDQFRGRWSLVFFGFTHCPDICPATMAVLSQVREQLADYRDLQSRLALYLVSVDPERDSPAVMREYLSWTNGRIRGVTGEHGRIAAFAGQVGVAFGKVPLSRDYGGAGHHDHHQGAANGGYMVDHSTQILIFNPRGHLHGYLKMPHEPQMIAQALRVLDRDG